MNQPHTRRLSSWPRLLGLALLLLVGVLASLGLVRSTAHAQPAATSIVSTCDESHLDSAINSAASGDILTFGCSGDILLTSTLTISKNLTLDGSGQNVTLDGGNSVQVLVVDSTANLTLTALTIANGSAYTGGGISNSGTLTISASTLSNNSASNSASGIGAAGGGISNGGMLTISASTVSNNSAAYTGGGIFNYGTLKMSTSTLSGNKADNYAGGGISNGGSGTMTIDASTLNNNASGLGGGLANLANTGTVTVSNSTLSGNYTSAGGAGGGIFNKGTVTLNNSTVSGNSAFEGGGGGISNPGTVNSTGSIVAENANGNCGNPGNQTDNGYNLESGSDCGFTGTGSLQNTNPLLDPNGLQNNGGPTQTIALQHGSPAIDRIPLASCPTTDQRGDARPENAGGTACDSGAYEVDYDLGLTNVPANITADATSPQGAVVTYTPPTVVDEESPLPTANCSPASGSTFPIGTTTVNCSVSGNDDVNSPVSASFTVTINPVLTASGTSVSATEGKSFSGVVVATGTAYGTGTLSASIDWGDGQTTSSTLVLAPDGSYSVKGSHVYDEEGPFAIKVTVSGSGGLNATASSSASVSDAALTANAPTAVISKLAVTLTTVFFDADPNGTVSDYSVTINWGDGSTSQGIISTNGTSFTATGSHGYARHKTYTVTVTINDAGGSSVTKTLSVKV